MRRRDATPGHFVRRLLGGWRTRRASEAGYAAILVSIIVPVVGIGCAATAVDTGRWYVEIQMVQKAADAAALAGVPYLPQDMPSAIARAKAVATRNGFDDADPDITVTAGVGTKPTQLLVTITSTIDNTFGAAIGVPRASVTRSAAADYQGPAPMGSPCNTFGNEPSAGTGSSSATPAGTARGSTPLANCSQTPQFWAVVEGPETGKVQGDRYQTRNCENTGVDGCTGTTNDEYDDFGYVFVVRVTSAAVGSPIDLQLYDPMMVNTGQTCSLLPLSTSFANDTNDTNPYVKNNDARDRYSRNGANYDDFCTGDSIPGAGAGWGTPNSLTTSFVLRQQSDTQNPKAAAVQNDTSGNACIKQYGAYNNSGNNIGAGLFQSGVFGYNAEISSEFHNWVNLCTFTPTRSGDYYLQVRTNVSLAGTGTGYIRSGNTAASAAAGNTTSGEGSNAFAIRAVTLSGREQQVAVSGYNHMPIFVNSSAAQTQFNLIRVLPGAAGQKISFSYYDAGDAQSSGSVQVQTPTDATGTITTTPFPGGCTAVGGSAGTGGTISNCTAPISQATPTTSMNNGKTETITIPIPPDYDCASTSLGGCWYRVTVAFGSGSVHDVTTWDATVIGDPVRLVE